MGSIIEHQRVARRRPNLTVAPDRAKRTTASPHIFSLSWRIAPMSRRQFRLPVWRMPRIRLIDVPLLVAVVGFVFLANASLLSMNLDNLLYSRALGRFELPLSNEAPALNTLFPARDGFDVIGEVSGVVPEQFARLEVTSYTVRSGDTISGIASRFGLKMDTVISFNRIEDVRRLRIGDRYQIPNRDGLLYTVKRGDTLSSIATQHGTTFNAIMDANDLVSRTIQDGQVLFVPGARMNDTELRLILGELFVWPTQGRYTSGFGMRPDPFTGVRRFHNGIDLANSVGTPIRAAAAGRVVHVETQVGNYGKFIIITHPGGFQTLYAHLDSFSVRNGQTVSRGQVIGSMGNTGRSTGPHLHFSVIRNGTFVNPLQFLN